MAKGKMDKAKLNSYISLAFPESIDVYSDEDINNDETNNETTKKNKNINNTSDILKRQGQQPSSMQGAGVSSSLPAVPAPQLANTAPGITLNTTADMPQLSFAQNDFATPQPAAISLPDSIARFNPMLFGGNADINKVARAVISEPDAPNTPTQIDTVARMTPEEKLMATVANTNPTPSSFWKRLLAGATQGAQQVKQGDDLGSAFGKILGPAVARSIPQVDSALKYEENKAKALEKYKLESGASNAVLQRRKVNQDIQNDAARIKREEEERARRVKLDLAAQLEKVEDNRRAEATLKLKALEKMSAGDPNRAGAVEELATKYGVKVGADYGVEARAKSAKETSETDLRRIAETEVTRELGATTKERARGATANQLEAELKAKMPPDLYAALTDPEAGSFKKVQAAKMRDEIEEYVYKRNLDYTESDFERRVASKIEESRGGGATTRSNKSVTQSNKGVTNKGAKVQASPQAKSTDARKVTFR